MRKHENAHNMADLDKTEHQALITAQEQLALQQKENVQLNTDITALRQELAFQKEEKGKRAAELGIANIELAFQGDEKEKRASELGLANIELAFQGDEKEKRAAELGIANIELLFQKQEKRNRADELNIANIELLFQEQEKKDRADELVLANKEKEQQELTNRELEAFNYRVKLSSQYSLSLIEASLDPLIAINNAGKITDMNIAMLNATEKTRAELTGTDFKIYFTDQPKAEVLYKEIFEKGFVNNYPLTIIDGQFTDVLFNGSVYKDTKGEVLGAVVVARDITVQNRIEQDLIKSLKEVSDYKYALDASSIVDVTDEFGTIKFVNENFCRVSQYTSEELVGTTHRITNSGHHPKSFMTLLWDTISSGKIWRDELMNTAKDGSIYWVLTTIVPFLNDKKQPYQYVAIRTDITEQKRIESELIEAKVQAELATSIAEEAKLKAESSMTIAENAVKSKQQFLSNMSHEIRTPMNAIIGFTKVVLKTELTAKQKEYIMAIKMSGDALIVLINDILDLAKVDAGKMTFEATPFKMSLSIAAMLHLFEPKIQEKNLSLLKVYDPNIPEVLIGDPVRLHQIILNLVSNAVKFTSQGQIIVSITLLSETDSKVSLEFAVTDTGIGISEDKIGSVFENFQQASSGTSRLYGGTGLGLAIVKQLVEQQGGTVSVKSKRDQGSTFSFILDFLKTEKNADVKIDLMESDMEVKHIKVLVVEDIPLNQLLMKTLLDDFGFERDMAGNGKIAIEKLKRHTYDIILMDLQMPEMNGFEATEYIRNTMKSQIPIIALTADVTTVDLAKCKAVGMNDYIAKPVDERLLFTKIVSLVKQPISNPVSEQDDVVIKCIDLAYLIKRTKNNSGLIMEMIAAYLEQTPLLVIAMKQSLHDKDWESLHAAVHKMIPSFSIMGIHANFENIAKQVQEYARLQQELVIVQDLVSQLEQICDKACIELQEELTNRTQHITHV